MPESAMPEPAVPDLGLAALRRKNHRAAIADFRRHLAKPVSAELVPNASYATNRIANRIREKEMQCQP